MEIKRTEEEIDRLEAWAAEGQNNGTHYNGMSYEDGIRDTLDWLSGRRDSSPADEE
jgi:hypothetical protein